MRVTEQERSGDVQKIRELWTYEIMERLLKLTQSFTGSQ